MSYNDTVDKLQTVIEADALTHMVVSQGDYDLFNESHAYVVVLDYSGLSEERATMKTSYHRDWAIEATLGVPFEHSKQANDDLTSLRQHCLDKVGANPSLGGELLQLRTITGLVLPELIEMGGGMWQMETLTFTIRELAVYS